MSADLAQKLQPHAKEIVIALGVILLALVLLAGKKKEKPVLDPVEFRPFKLIKKTQLSKNTYRASSTGSGVPYAFSTTSHGALRPGCASRQVRTGGARLPAHLIADRRYRFALPSPTASLGLPIGQHISIMANIDGKQVMRSYTPTSLDNDKGYFELVVKAYEQGNISKYLSKLNEGDSIMVKGPKGKFNYTKDLSPHLLMIAGGTGITPMYQIIKSSVMDPTDKTEIELIYANVDEGDIRESRGPGDSLHLVLREELERLSADSNNRFKLYDMIKERMHKAGVSSGSKVLLCGPPPMMTAMKGHLKELGYPAPRTVSKLEDQVFLF
ncbi:NADH-cytochrome b5 reductase [Trichosporon asahii var. asahii CBS 8904]|uniref:NADH-cytochrome b5 reductase n=1 Tax=Trichosporon asahii var. asahii (strain CBS 8904) TaxID=1220162 RepID=K1VR59_TRIAC|nr:NADH-cytochrome b5 reductase [Trichosporon asahii var. asahii CBS 8904]